MNGDKYNIQCQNKKYEVETKRKQKTTNNRQEKVFMLFEMLHPHNNDIVLYVQKLISQYLDIEKHS